MTNQERAAEVLRDDKHYKMGPHGEQFLTSEAARSLADAGLLMPDPPEPKWPGFWEVDGLEINVVDKDGEVLIEREEESDYTYYGTQTRTLWLNRKQVLAIIAAAKLSEEQE